MTSGRRRIGAVVSLAICSAALAAGCGGGGSGHSSITLYNGQHTQLTTSLVAAFEKATGVKVQIRTADSAVLADQIVQEGSASPADVYISENSPELMELQRRGLLAALPQSTLSQSPAQDRSPAGDWVGMALRVSSLVYDPAKLPASQLPASILDLAKPQWKGKIAIAPTDSDFPPIVAAVIAKHGMAVARTWLEGLERNARTYQDEESIVSAVNRGDVVAGIVNQYYWYRLQLELGKSGMHSTLHYFPNGDVGSVVNVSGAAVLKSSGRAGNAQKFVDFLVSEAGQKIIAASDDFEYVVRPGVAPNPALPPLARIGHTSLDVSALGNGEVAAKLIQQAGLV